MIDSLYVSASGYRFSIIQNTVGWCGKEEEGGVMGSLLLQYNLY